MDLRMMELSLWCGIWIYLSKYKLLITLISLISLDGNCPQLKSIIRESKQTLFAQKVIILRGFRNGKIFFD